MARPEKTEVITEFKGRVQGSSIAVATKYIGIKAEQATALRKKLRDNNIQFKVFKNTLVQRALDELGLSDAGKFMVGPIAWAFSKDPVVPAKILKDYNREVPLVEMNGGILEGKVVTKAQLEVLAVLPAREVLLAQVIGTMVAPLRNFVSVLSAPSRDLVNVLDQIRKQKEQGAAA